MTASFYAQLAVDPLVRDPRSTARSTTRHIVRGAFSSRGPRTRSGLAAPSGFSRSRDPNVLTWLLFAWLLCRWMPPSTPRAFVLWAGCLLSPGMLSSVRYALPDGPGALLVAAASPPKRRPVIAALIVGLSGLARETNLLASTFLARFFSPRSAQLGADCRMRHRLAPLALWVDYLRSIYRAQALTNPGQVTMPLAGLGWKLHAIRADLVHAPFAFPTLASALAVAAFLAQGGW